MLNYALLGFGGLGKIHFKNLLEIEKSRGDIRLVAICGADKKNLTETVSINLGGASLENIDFSRFRLYDTVDELLENEKLDFVISALPTVMHAETAEKLLNHGINVFSEKPMALTWDDCERMVKAAKDNNKILMIGQCVRFSGAHQKIMEYIRSGIYGKPYRAEFTRYSCLPTWTFNNWILDIKQSGGCPIDLHIHDVDLINLYFGMPKSVTSKSTNVRTEFESICTTYEYDDILVTATADWSFPQSYPFKPSLTVMFEKAAVTLTGEQLTVYTDENSFEPEYDKEDYFKKELKEFVNSCVSGKESAISNAESVMGTMKIVMAELDSAKQNGTKIEL